MKTTTWNLVELDATEMTNIEGGSKGIWGWLIKEIIENWDEIKRGASDGWNGRPYNP